MNSKHVVSVLLFLFFLAQFQHFRTSELGLISEASSRIVCQLEAKSTHASSLLPGLNIFTNSLRSIVLPSTFVYFFVAFIRIYGWSVSPVSPLMLCYTIAIQLLYRLLNILLSCCVPTVLIFNLKFPNGSFFMNRLLFGCLDVGLLQMLTYFLFPDITSILGVLIFNLVPFIGNFLPKFLCIAVNLILFIYILVIVVLSLTPTYYRLILENWLNSVEFQNREYLQDALFSGNLKVIRRGRAQILQSCTAFSKYLVMDILTVLNSLVLNGSSFYYIDRVLLIFAHLVFPMMLVLDFRGEPFISSANFPRDTLTKVNIGSDPSPRQQQELKDLNFNCSKSPIYRHPPSSGPYSASVELPLHQSKGESKCISFLLLGLLF